jgi:hypothetical protein
MNKQINIYNYIATMSCENCGKKLRRYRLPLTRDELLHLRDMLSIMLENNQQTISSLLARAENRVEVEEDLWESIFELCEKAGLDTNEAAPDYLIGLIEPELVIKKAMNEGEVQQ